MGLGRCERSESLSCHVFAEIFGFHRKKNINSNVDGEQIHLKAILKMLKGRGSLQRLGWNVALLLCRFEMQTNSSPEYYHLLDGCRVSSHNRMIFS